MVAETTFGSRRQGTMGRSSHSMVQAMKWDVYVYDPRSKSTVTHVLEYPRTSRSGGAAVVQMAARDLSVSPDRVLALPHRGSAEPPRGGEG